VRALERGLAIITAFDAKHPELTLSDVARTTGLPRAVVRRFLYTLEDLGYGRTDGKTFSLRPRVLRLGYAYLSSFGLPEPARTHLEELVADIDESVALGVLDDTEMVCVARVPSKRLTAVTVKRRHQVPRARHVDGPGAAVRPAGGVAGGVPGDDDVRPADAEQNVRSGRLRELVAQAALDGWALVDQELEIGLRTIAVPVRDGGDIVAAINVSVHVDRHDGEIVAREMVPRLQRTARAIELDLRMSPRR
jgi:IclR family pca regulon transcriptional regulator